MIKPPDVNRHKTAGHEYMRALRERTGLSQVEWATLVGSSEIKVRRIETGWHGFDYATQYLWEATAAKVTT